MDAKEARNNRLFAIENGERTYIGRPCKRCGSSIKTTRQSSCFECSKKEGLKKLNDPILMAKYRTPEKEKRKQINWRKNNPEKLQAQRNRRKGELSLYYRKNKDGYRDKSLQKYYGISLTEYDEILTKQNGVCAICNTKPKTKNLAVDHDHTTNRVRGLLCSNCNTGLGLFKDEPNLLKKSIKYLKETTNADCTTQ